MIKEFNTVVQLEKEWKQIASQNNINYCQSYSWTRYTEIFCSSNFFKRLYFGKIKYFALYREDKCQIIIPVQLNGKVGNLLGWRTPNDYEGILFSSNLLKDDIREIFDYIFSKYSLEKLNCGLITPKQNNIVPLLEYLTTLGYKIEKNDSFNVALTYNYENFNHYFNSLSKSTRQNYRTSLNRLNKDKRLFDFYFYEDKIPEQEVECFLSDHKDRLKTRYLKARSPIVEYVLSPTRLLIYGKYRRDGIAALSMRGLNRQILAIMKIDGRNAAYYYGVLCKTQGEGERINFFRVCVNEKDFGFYSPGMVLGVEIIKKYQNRFRVYDFTKGDEAYKYKLGCQNEEDFFIMIKNQEKILNN